MQEEKRMEQVGFEQFSFNNSAPLMENRAALEKRWLRSWVQIHIHCPLFLLKNKAILTEKHIPNPLANTIHGKDDQLPMRLDTYISPRGGGHKEACNDTW